jgi:hypothetical protein
MRELGGGRQEALSAAFQTALGAKVIGYLKVR